MMRAIRLAVACVAVLFATAGQVQAGVITIDFDDFTSTSSFGGGVEEGIEVGDINGPVAVDGAGLGPLSLENSIHNNGSGFASFSLSARLGDTFTLSSFFAGSVGVADQLTLIGFLGDSLVGSDSFSPSGGYLEFEPTDLLGKPMTTLLFIMGSVSDPATTGFTFIDDIELNVNDAAAVPEPTSLALFAIGACVAGLSTARRRRRENQQVATA